MGRYRRPWAIGLAVTTGALVGLSVGGQLLAQTAPLSSGPIAVDATPFEASPKLLPGPKGETLRLWYRGVPPSMGGVVLAASTGGDWRTLTEIIPQEKDVTAAAADVAVSPSGQLAVVYQWWRRMPTSSKQIRLARSSDGGKTWVQSETSLDTSGRAFAPKAAWGRDQTLVVTWSDEQRSNRVWDVYARRSPDGGVTWESEQLLSRFPQNAPTDAYIRPELVSDGQQNFWAVWVGIRSGRSRLYLSRSTDGGQTWGDPVELSGQSQSVYAQRLVRAGNRLFLVWQDKRTGRDRLFGISSSDGGSTWTPPSRVDHVPDDRLTDAVGPMAVMSPTGEVFVTWYDGRNGRDDIFLGRSPDGGRTWDDKDVRLDADEAGTSVSRFPTIARAADGRLAVAWDDDRAGFERVYVRVRSAGARPTWGPEIVVEPPGPKLGVKTPSVAWAADGSLQMAWEVWNYVAGPMAVTKRIDGRTLALDKK